MNIALAGFGQEGRASYDYWNRDNNKLTVADEREGVNGLPDAADTILGPDAFSKLDTFDLIIRSPSVNPKKLPYGEKVWSATNEFFQKCPAQIIGVTGTKGKGTTCSLIASILTAAGKTVHLLGNIGTPALSVLADIKPDDIVVFELSSFQLWDVQKSPHVAVVLAIEPDHLDIHDDLDDYINAKGHIASYQTVGDLIVFNKTNEVAHSIAERSPAAHIPYPDPSIMTIFGPSLVIPGQHNIENASAAVEAVQEYVSDPAVIKQGLSTFLGLPHRIKFVRELNGIRFYDDSYSSAAAASVAALKSFQEPKIIILGGFEKYAAFDGLARYIADTPSVKKALLIGQTRQRIRKALEANGVEQSRYEVIDIADFSKIVDRASELAQAGDVVLLSPGSASFDMFKNFTDRGEQFVSIVNAL